MAGNHEAEASRIEENPLVAKTLRERARLSHHKAKARERERRVEELMPGFETAFVDLLNTSREKAPLKWKIGKPGYARYEIGVPIEGEKKPIKVTVYGQTYESDVTDEGEVTGIQGFDMYINGMPTSFNRDLSGLTIKNAYSNDRQQARPPKPSEVTAYTNLAIQLSASITEGTVTVVNKRD